MKPGVAKARIVSWLLIALFTWQGLALGWKSVVELASTRRATLMAALSQTEEERIAESMRIYDSLGGGPQGLYALHRAVREHSEPGARIFVVRGEEEYILRALTGLSGFFYPWKVHIARGLPTLEERGDRPDLLVLTMRGPFHDSPRGFKEPVAETPQWTLWK